MTARPGQWELLGEDSDPLAGDSVAVTSAAKHYTTTAGQIRDQVKRLRQIADDDHSKQLGKYVEPLKDSAKDLADHLTQAQGRFDTVAHELNRWAPVLEHAHTETGSLLRQAEAAQHDIDRHQPPDKPVDKKDDHAVAADKKRAHDLSDAQGELGRIKKKYDDLMNTPLPDGVKAIADDVAKKIDDASHDKLKNRRFDGFRKWVHDHAGLLKLIADVLTWIATAIVIAVLIVGTGGLGLAAILTAVALGIHTILALQGDGSWTDVALDAFALVTMGTGKMLTSGAKVAMSAKEGAVAYGDAVSGARSAFASAEGFSGKASVWLRQSNPIARTFGGLRAGRGAYAATMDKFTENVGFKESMRLLAHPSDWSVTRVFNEGGARAAVDLLNFGDKNAADINAAINADRVRYGSGFLLNSAHRLMFVNRFVFPASFGTDITFKAMNPAFPNIFTGNFKDPDPIKIPIGPWSDWADEHTVPHGGYWR